MPKGKSSLLWNLDAKPNPALEVPDMPYLEIDLGIPEAAACGKCYSESLF